MKNIVLKAIIAVFTITLITSCGPQSKEAYLEGYRGFIAKVKTNSDNYTQEDWTKRDAEFERYSNEYYLKYKDQLTWQEQLLVAKYNVEYTTLKTTTDISDFYNLFVKDSFEELKKQIQTYSENDMKEDLRFLIDQANDIGEEAAKAVEEILKELEINMEDLEQ